MAFLLLGLVAIYLVLCAFLYFKQDSFLFYPLANDAAIVQRYANRRIVIPGSEINIEGWWRENPSTDNKLIVLYFGGNAEDVIYAVASADRLHARKFLAANYRGYGKTQGSPDQAGLFKDALAIYDYVAAQPSVSADDIIVMGRSLGSGVATYLASQRPVRAAILITPYDSIAAIAQRQFPFFPVKWLLKSKFPSVEFAAEIRVPVLMLLAENDGVVPAVHSRRLYEAWQGPKQIAIIANTQHNDIGENAEYYDRINSFIAGAAARQ